MCKLGFDIGHEFCAKKIFLEAKFGSENGRLCWAPKPNKILDLKLKGEKQEIRPTGNSQEPTPKHQNK